MYLRRISCVRQNQIGSWTTVVARQRGADTTCDDNVTKHGSWWCHGDRHVTSSVRSVTDGHVGRKWRHQDNDGAWPRAGDAATSADDNQRPWRAPCWQTSSTPSCRQLDPAPRDQYDVITTTSGIRPTANAAWRRCASPAAQCHL